MLTAHQQKRECKRACQAKPHTSPPNSHSQELNTPKARSFTQAILLFCILQAFLPSYAFFFRSTLVFLRPRIFFCFHGCISSSTAVFLLPRSFFFVHGINSRSTDFFRFPSQFFEICCIISAHFAIQSANQNNWRTP